jgi:hypothetical protein
VYAVFGAAGNVENAHFPDEGHDYGPSKREAMYRFMAKHLGLNLKAALTSEGKIDESVTTLPEADITVFTADHPRPPAALKDSAEVAAALAKAKTRD